MSERIEKLRDAVQVAHRCTAVHIQSVPVVEMFGSLTAWEGVVEVFNITGHSKAKRCYAWYYPDKGEAQFTTVLEIPPVVSPQTAVRAAIVATDKSKSGSKP